eukprot:TRINITY_DN15692_c0_g1_i1.p1 TRINITY_DN15692_c0_g1~~TRINITY_DN15692_c0_g1_i1.p1  ORF type:complete len:671 (-),score=156.98 TRINITY_DN15692_c0_g1_i1:49-2061(-)
MMSDMDIPEEMKKKLMAQLGVSSEHIDEALSLAQKSPNVGVTPFLQHMRKVTEFFKTFKNEKEKLRMFAECSTLEERINMVYQAIQSHPEYKEVRNMFPEQRYKVADIDKSKQFRDKGNKLYQAKQFKEAIKTYTESAVHTVIDENGKSKELALALGNRSAVYFQMEDYSKCLEDLEAAMMFGYPEEMQYKLFDRKGRCQLQCDQSFEAQESLEMASLLVQKSKLKEDDKHKFKQEIKNTMQTKMEQDVKNTHNIAFPTILEQHPALPGLCDKIDVRYNSEQGRHSLATQSIEPGEVVITDSPVTWCLSFNYALTHCHHCCKPLCGAGFPSPLSRQENIMFCTLECLQTASTTYHKHEAAVPLPSLFRKEVGHGSKGGYDEISGTVLMALRVLTQKPCSFFTERNWLGDAKVDYIESEVNDDDDDSYMFKTLFNMVTHHADRSEADLLSTSMKTIFILQLLDAMNYTKLDAKHPLGPLIFHILEAIQYNTHPIDEVTKEVDPNKNVDLLEIGSAVFPSLASCLNHSCDPSTVRVCVGNQIALFSRKRIEVGEEVTDCYGFHYTSLSKAERQRRIKKWFNFECHCLACSKNFPVMANLTNKMSQKTLESLKDLLEKFQWALKNKHLKKSLDICIQYLQKLKSLQVPQPHKAWEAGSHALSCSLWAIYGNIQ